MEKIEFKNLPNTTTPITAENLNTLQDNIEEAMSYSTSEIIIGKWINGKPLYRKVLRGTLPTATETNTFSITNSVIHKVSGHIQSVYGVWAPINEYYINEPSYSIYYLLNSNRDSVSITCGAFYSTSSQYEIILEYSKTTD